MNALELADDFPDYTRADWRALAEKGLRVADFDTLVSETESGLRRGPLFDAALRPETAVPLGSDPAPLLEGRPWHVCAPVTDPDFAYANAQLLEDLEGGASAVRIGDLPISRRADLKRLLEGVYLTLVPVVFAPGSPAARYALGTEELYGTPVTLGLDPLGEMPSCPDTWRAFTVDAAAVHEAGGDDRLELAVMAAIVAESVRRHGPDAASHFSLQLACGTDAHLNIVKLRAARRLHAGVAEGFEVDGNVPVHAVSSLRMMQGQDAWTNLLRTMSAGFGAVAGGADYIMLHPFTDTPAERRLGEPTAFGHRLARNQQLLMMEESRLGQVGDPAHGSYFHERLTEELAQSAWSLFQNIEAIGGIETWRETGGYASALDAATAARAERAEPILGVTLHPSDDVPAPEVR